MCAQRLFASEVDAGDSHLVGQLVGVVVALPLGQTPVDPAPLAGEL